MKNKLQIAALILTIASSVVGGIWQLYELGYDNGRTEALLECKNIIDNNKSKCQKALRKCRRGSNG